MAKQRDLIGQKFGRLTVIAIQDSINSKRRWLCRCDCGKEIITYEYRLLCGQTKSCRCLQRDIVSKHGDYLSAENGIWRSMIQRCYNPKEKRYADYGGRGINVSDRWRGQDGYINFLSDMGRKPEGRYSIERLDNNGNYEPLNCKWATQKEQMRNTRRNHLISFNGETKCLTDWAITLGISVATLYRRLQKGLTIDRLLSPIKYQREKRND